MQPRIDILPPPQQRLWPELQRTPKDFVLYGGTALALRLGHRQSEDFDFFSTNPFSPMALRNKLSYLKEAEVIQQTENTLTCLLDRDGRVQVSFFGGLPLNRVDDPEQAIGPGINVASLLDLAATKVDVIQSRASAKDYIDIDALIREGLSLEQALGAAQAVMGPQFNPMLSLKALTFFGDGDLETVPQGVRQRLALAVNSVDLDRVPKLSSKRGLAPGGVEL